MAPGNELGTPVLLGNSATSHKQSNGRLAIHVTSIIPFVDLGMIAMSDIVIAVQWLRLTTGTNSHCCAGMHIGL